MTLNSALPTLPTDLKACEDMILQSFISYSSSNYSEKAAININIEGVKLSPVLFRLADKLSESGISFIVAFSDVGNVALSKRDYPDYQQRIFSFKDITSGKPNVDFDFILANSPQPYDYDEFLDMCNSTNQAKVMLNGKLEETSIGVGFVGRERRANFIKSWVNIFHLEPMKKGTLMHIYSQEWHLFKYFPEGFKYVTSFKSRPDLQIIDETLNTFGI